MKLIAFKGRRPGWAGIANLLIQWRLRGEFSHCEVMFEPGDGVDHLMPDGTCSPDGGLLWCASSVASEAMPDTSPRRAGSQGGVRFKRLALTDEWEVFDLPGIDPRAAATAFLANQGAMYDWQLIAGFMAWLVPGKASRWTCSEICAKAMGLPEPHRFDPCNLVAVARMVGAR